MQDCNSPLVVDSFSIALRNLDWVNRTVGLLIQCDIIYPMVIDGLINMLLLGWCMGTRCPLTSSSYTDWSSFLIPGISVPVAETLRLGILFYVIYHHYNSTGQTSLLSGKKSQHKPSSLIIIGYLWISGCPNPRMLECTR